MAAFDSVSHRLLDQALAAANASNKSRAIFRAIYGKAATAVRVRGTDGTDTISEPFAIRRGVVQGDIFSPYAYILALAFLFFKHDPEVAADTGVTIGGGIKIASAAYADDSGLCCNDEDEANRRLTTMAGGLSKDGGKEISVPKTFGVAFEPRADISDVTEAAIAATDGLVQCEFCGKNFEDGRSLYQHQTGISPHDKQPWCPLAHMEVTEEDYEIDARSETGLVISGTKLVWKQN